MRALVLDSPKSALRIAEVPTPTPGPGQVLLRVHACAVCRTDLHVVDGELARPKLPLIPGHEVVGSVVAAGPGAARFPLGTRLGVPWLGSTCGRCRFCTSDRENLCEQPGFTGYTLDGGYAEYMVADERYCFPLPASLDDLHAAPLLCAGLIGYRSLRMAGEARTLGLYGFGAAAHILIQVARHQGRRVFAFVRPGDREAREHALRLGAEWAGSSLEAPPALLEAAIVFAPVGALVPAALKHLDRGGTVVCGGIHMSDLPGFPYELLWQERSVRSVANLTRRDAEEFLALAPNVPVRTEVTVFPLESANEALAALRAGRISGAAVLAVSGSPAFD